MNRYAAVDIGSNAVRLLFCEVHDQPESIYPTVKKISLVRLPIRLGDDVFSHGAISEEKMIKLSQGLQAFRLLLDVYGIEDYRICATSAMREANNNQVVVDRIKKDAGVDIEVIAGKEEAQLIFDTHISAKLNQKKTYLYVDVGGGSTELTVFSEGEKIASRSFKIGTIRLKNDIVVEKQWEDMKAWILEMRESYHPETAIGTGGNINELYKLCGLTNWELLEYDSLKKMNQDLLNYSVKDRMKKFSIRADRSDVITHAAKIYLTVMEFAGIKNMVVPKVGLADGIIHGLFKDRN